ncbi:MAG TPA: cysteine desulfurase family protein [Candidatus Binatia bacterium]|nr:cysteine desulfurase family protein [Candidatus Binatia bacterium]
MSERNIYLDHGATTPVDPRVLEAMLPYWTDAYGNPASGHHFGRQAERGLDEARRVIAGLIRAQPGEIVFTGCGSESDNLALRGAMWAARAAGRGNHLITSAVEHKAVLETARQLQRQSGFEVTVVAVDKYGQVDPQQVAAAVRSDTVLISIMAANNEVGTLQPVQSIGEMARERGVLFHTDAIQAVAVTPWDMQEMPFDMVSFAPHKFYGPKGIGFLYVRRGTHLVPTLTGGSQEEGLRAGTVNVPYAVGASEAFRLAMLEREANIVHYRRLRDRLVDGILKIGDDCMLTGHPTERLPHNASFAFRDLSGNDLLIHLDAAGIAASSGSACSTGNPRPSSVLKAMGLDDSWARGGLRLTVGRQNTDADVDALLEILPRIVSTLRKFQLQYV